MLIELIEKAENVGWGTIAVVIAGVFMFIPTIVESWNKTDQKQITQDDVYVVWYCKTLQNHKALLSTTVSDGMYYEITHNGDKQETYVDAYKKWENFVVR